MLVAGADMDNGWLVDVAKELGGVFGVAIAAVVLTIFKKLRFSLVGSLKRMWVTHPLSPSRQDAEQNMLIHTELVELRALVDSDRAYVLRFHNGTEFLPDNPVWKVTCTHEVVRPGVSYESANLQGLIVSRIHNLVDPLVNGESKYKGVSVADCNACALKVKCDRENKHVVVVQVGDLEGSFSKFLLDGQNIKTVVQAGVVGTRGRVFGIVGVDFCDAKLSDQEELRLTVEKVCRSAEKIQYYLQYKNLPLGKKEP